MDRNKGSQKRKIEHECDSDNCESDDTDAETSDSDDADTESDVTESDASESDVKESANTEIANTVAANTEIANTESDVPVQLLSIHWIDLKRAEITSQHPDKSCLLKAIKRIVDEHNDKIRKNTKDKKKKKKGYEPEEKEYTGSGYCFKHYSYRNIYTPNIARQSQDAPKRTKTSNYLVFLYKCEPSARIIALTSGKAYAVVRPYVDHSFPFEVAERVCNPKNIRQITRRCLLKATAKETLLYPDEHDLYKTSNLYYLVKSFRCEIKKNSKLFSKINPSKINPKLFSKKKGRCWIEVTTGGILRIGKRLRLKVDYPAILDLFADYMEGRPTLDNGGKEEKDPLFDFLHRLQPTRLKKNKLDKLLIKNIFFQHDQGEEIHINVRHKYLEDFLFSDSFEIQIGSSRFKEIGSKPPTIEEIMDKIPHASEEEFIQAIQTSSLRFTNQATGEKYEDKIVDFLEGELRDEAGDLHFKMGKMWYILGWDYLALLHEDFTRVIRNVLIKENSEWQLPLPWKDEKEATYNRYYLKEEGYLVFDQICPDNIEPCDILKHTEDAVYLYHVKRKFNQDTRVVCSQILNAATLIRSALVTRQSPNYLEKVWSQATNIPWDGNEWRKTVKRELESLGKELFFDIFHKKIVFVYAYLPRANQSLSSMLKASDEPIEEMLSKKLIKAGHLDSYGRLTGNFFATNKEDFQLEGKKVTKKYSNTIYDQLNARNFSESTLAKMEVVQLAQNLRNLDFDFQICEIPRE